MRARALILIAVLSSPLFAQAPSSFERVLVPVLNPSQVVHGANGSQFRTGVALYLREGTIDYYPAAGERPAVGSSLPRSPYLPIWEAEDVVAKGRFLFFSNDGARPAIFASLSVQAEPGGPVASTPLPVVHERNALASPVTIGSLSFHSTFDSSTYPPTFIGFRQRHTLRIYDFGSTGAAAVRVRFQRWGPVPGVPIERTIYLSSRDADDASYPFYFEANVEQLFGSQCGPHPRALCGSFIAVIEVEPLATDTRYFAFVSTTQNDTNHVSIHLPQ